MTSELFRAPTADELELARLQLELESRRIELDRLQGESKTLETSLSAFAADVKLRVGDVKDEIRQIRRDLEEMRKRTTRLRSDPLASPADVEREVAEEMAEAEFDSEPIGPPPGYGRGKRRGTTHRANANDAEVEILRIYRELAKRHHPDLARTAAERERRADLMLRVNIAYRDRDLETLRSIFHEVQMDSPLTPDELCRRRLSWTRNEISRIEREIRALIVRIDTLTGTDTYTLWQAAERGEPALEELETRTRERLARERERLEDATAQYNRLAVRRQVMQRRAANRAYDSARASGAND